MTLAAGLIFFQDRDSLKRTLDSLKDFDVVFAIDGAFATYRSENRLSTDGSRELCMQYPNVQCFDAADCSEPDKRSLYLQRAAEIRAEHLLIVDSDEWIEGDLQEFRRNLPKEPGIYSVNLIDLDGNHDLMAALVSRPEQFVYHRAHNIFKNLQTGEIFKNRADERKVVKGIVKHSDRKLRSKERIQAGQEYKEQLFKYEKPIKVELCHG